MSINGTREFLLNHRTSVLYLTIGFFFVIASLRLGYETWRLVLDTSESGANDLLTFKNQLQLWFSGIPVYTEQVKAPYPPASWMIFWPLISQIDWPAIRWIWAAILVPVLALLVYIIIFESGSNSRIEKVAITLFILAIYPTVIVMGNGQFTLHILLSLIASILLLHRNNNKWVRFLIASPLLLFSFFKPTISAPFLWIVFIRCRALVEIILIAISYLLLTFWAISFQHDGLIIIINKWLFVGASNPGAGYAHFYNWLNPYGYGRWATLCSILIFFLLGIWVYFRRNSCIWILLGVSALVARFFTYHRLYDDLLILLPILALFRIVRERHLKMLEKNIGQLLLILSSIGLLAPATLLRLPYPYGTPFRMGQTIIWLLMLVFLIIYNKRYYGDISTHRKEG